MIQYNLEEKTLLIRFLVTELDHHIARNIREDIDEIISSKPINNIIFDFKNISFMDSSGIGVIIGRYRKISLEGGKVIAININDRVKKIFDISGLNKIIGVYDTYEEAVSSF